MQAANPKWTDEEIREAFLDAMEEGLKRKKILKQSIKGPLPLIRFAPSGSV